MATKGRADKIDFLPTPGYLIVKPIENSQPPTDIFIVDDKSFPQYAIVVEVGDAIPVHSGQQNTITIPPCDVGDEIFHSSAGFEKIRIKNNEYRIVPFDKVLAVKSK
jgi:co-chaperonin GroES (HSP10)